ncbi:MAG: hypothetical protein R3338_12385 [Thermoanaerobaculia bacterium]|nr:hypothetical protein [Thermoanaerobaculia bacterium]
MTRSCFQGPNSGQQSGFVLISVLLIAILYFGLIELVLTESAEKMREANRFRARISANILAENGAELAAAQMTNLDYSQESLETDHGTMSGTFRRVGQSFVIEGIGSSKGVIENTRKVTIRGTIEGESVSIERTDHDR